MLNEKEKDFIAKKFSADEQSDANKLFILFRILHNNLRSMRRIAVIGIVIVGIIYSFDYVFAAGVISLIIALIMSWFVQKKKKDFDKIDNLFISDPDRWAPISEKLRAIL